MKKITKTFNNLCRVLVVSFFLTTNVSLVFADPVDTSVTVGNSAPTFSVAPAESPASDSTNPTNVGSSVTFTATGTDSNSEDVYLAICKTNSVTATNSGAPTCGGGDWCISSATDSGSEATCSYTALSGDAESNAWYAFVCDGNSSAAACSSSSQGTGSSGSPFKVNHVPGFSAAADPNPDSQIPGGSIDFAVTASDSDTDGTSDTVTLIVCKTSGLSNGACDGGPSDTWCTSSSEASNPTCSITLDNPMTAGSRNAYYYIVDNHNLPATSANQGSNNPFTVSNVAPVVTSVTLNSGSDITLTEGTTTDITLTATVTDNNSCQDISAVTGYLYRSGIGYASCDGSGDNNGNHCYAEITCTVGGGDSCTGDTDASASYTCTVSVQYFADPTVASTLFPSETWKSTIKATDPSNSATTEVSTGVEMNTLLAYSVGSSINYGSLSAGQSNDPLDKTLTMAATGNVGLDAELEGADMTSGANSIGVENQKYSKTTSTAYASGTALSSSPTELELDVKKTTTTTPEEEIIYFGLSVPGGTAPGTYSGSNTVGAIMSETAGW